MGRDRKGTGGWIPGQTGQERSVGAPGSTELCSASTPLKVGEAGKAKIAARWSFSRRTRSATTSTEAKALWLMAEDAAAKSGRDGRGVLEAGRGLVREPRTADRADLHAAPSGRSSAGRRAVQSSPSWARSSSAGREEHRPGALSAALSAFMSSFGAEARTRGKVAGAGINALSEARSQAQQRAACSAQAACSSEPSAAGSSAPSAASSAGPRAIPRRAQPEPADLAAFRTEGSAQTYGSMERSARWPALGIGMSKAFSTKTRPSWKQMMETQPGPGAAAG